MNLRRTLTAGGLSIPTPLFCAPMAGVSHSAFRRLVARFGGYGALFTEMLPGKALLNENVGATPFTLRRPEEGTVWYQLALNGREDVAAVVDRLSAVRPAALDLNAGCPAPEIERQGMGAALFADEGRFSAVLGALRKAWPGVLSVKCRLWKTDGGWMPEFTKRLKIMEDRGVDMLTVHPRFFGEKLKRRARWEHFAWIRSRTKLPLIANGDIGFVSDIETNGPAFAPVDGVMIGRQAAVRPWIFKEFSARFRGGEAVGPVDYAEVWKTYYDYVNEDFPPERAIGRLKEFAKYYSCNFFFGHQLKTAVQRAGNLGELHAAAMKFLSAEPKTVERPSVSGI
jgi:tRNA-dihydrouridine synthase B